MLLARAAGLESRTEPGEPCLVMSLPESGEELQRWLPANIAHNVRYYRRRAQRMGAVRVEAADGSNLHELVEGLFRLHGARWEQRGQRGVLADRGVERMQREAIPALHAAGMLRTMACG